MPLDPVISDLRSRVEAAGESGLPVSAEELADALGGRERAERALQRHGVHSDPRLDRGAPESTLRPDAGYAAQGTLGVGLAAVAVGLLKATVYGVIFGTATAIAIAIITLRWDLVDARVPARIPRGRLTGALVAVACVVVLGIVLAVPARVFRGA